MTRKLSSLFLSALLMPTLSACAATLEYSAEPIEAWVVDAETKQPLEGVIVVAHWQMAAPMEEAPMGQLEVMETVTDKAGRFHFPGWGPKWYVGIGHLSDSGPGLIFFKSGFEYRNMSNSQYSGGQTYSGGSGRYSDIRGSAGVKPKPKGTSVWSGGRIEMKRFGGGLEKYLGNFTDFNRALEHVAVRDPKECNWKKLPHSIRTISLERKRLESLRIRPYGVSAIDDRLLANDNYYIKEGGCGSPKEFFGGFE